MSESVQICNRPARAQSGAALALEKCSQSDAAESSAPSRPSSGPHDSRSAPASPSNLGAISSQGSSPTTSFPSPSPALATCASVRNVFDATAGAAPCSPAVLSSSPAPSSSSVTSPSC